MRYYDLNGDGVVDIYDKKHGGLGLPGGVLAPWIYNLRVINVWRFRLRLMISRLDLIYYNCYGFREAPDINYKYYIVLYQIE